MQPLLNGSITTSSPPPPVIAAPSLRNGLHHHHNHHRFGARQPFIGYFSNNRKKIFLLLCAFIMGTWIGSSIPGYRFSPQPCSTIQMDAASLSNDVIQTRSRAAISDSDDDKSFVSNQPLLNGTKMAASNYKNDAMSSIVLPTSRPTTTTTTTTTANPFMPAQSSNFISETGSVDHANYLVHTSSCRIPRFDPFDPTLEDAIVTLEPLHCAKLPPLTFVQDNTLQVNESNLKQYGVQHVDDLSCCYSVLQRLEDGNSDDLYLISENCTTFQNSTDLTDEFVKVSCRAANDSIKLNYTDFYYTVPLKIDVEKRVSSDASGASKVSGNSQKPFSIMLIGLDAVSRLNFERHLHRTRTFLLDKLEAIEMMGYNKVGDNTFPNIIALLTGYSSKELEEVCWKERQSNLDNCPFVWTRFSELGYRTLYGEDCYSITSFNYLKKGFFRQPTDYYLRPFVIAAEKTIGWAKSLNTKLCLGPRPVHEMTLTWAQRFMEAMSEKPYFGIVWTNSLTHDDANYVQRTDHFLEDLLESLSTEGHINDTILVFLSDHGIRWGPLRNTRIGRYEENLPALYISLPLRFRQDFPKAFDNLKTNSRRLTSTFDLHKMLLALTAQASGSAAMVFNSSSMSLNGDPIVSERGVSLFDEVPWNRTCEEAGINAHWCACDETIALSTVSLMALSMAEFVVRELNYMVSLHRDHCVVLELGEIISVLRRSNVEMHIKHKHDFHYTISLRVVPSFAVFEATVLSNGENFTVEGEISRLNLYGNQSACLSDLQLKKFCYCHNMNISFPSMDTTTSNDETNGNSARHTASLPSTKIALYRTSNISVSKNPPYHSSVSLTPDVNSSSGQESGSSSIPGHS